MKILFLSHHCFPHIGGVEKHIKEVAQLLKRKGHRVKIVAKDHPIKYKDVKFFGLFKIWLEILKIRSLIAKSDIVHIHDVFVWYLPFKLLFPRKKIFVTFHGGQDVWPIPLKSKLYKKIACKLSNGTIAVGSFINKYYKIKATNVIYGGVNKHKNKFKRVKDNILWIGRLDRNTDLPAFLKWLERNEKKALFVGDGELKNECEEYGQVLGFVKNPTPYLEKSETVAPVGYLSYLEAKVAGCKIITFPKTPIKKDYWKGIQKLKRIPSWEDVVGVYLRMWRI